MPIRYRWYLFWSLLLCFGAPLGAQANSVAIHPISLTSIAVARLQAQGGGLETSVKINSGGSGVVTGTDALLALGELQASLFSA